MRTAMTGLGECSGRWNTLDPLMEHTGTHWNHLMPKRVALVHHQIPKEMHRQSRKGWFDKHIKWLATQITNKSEGKHPDKCRQISFGFSFQWRLISKSKMTGSWNLDFGAESKIFIFFVFVWGLPCTALVLSMKSSFGLWPRNQYLLLEEDLSSAVTDFLLSFIPLVFFLLYFNFVWREIK